MLDLTAWMRLHDLAARPWMILGKGPTFACHRQHDLSAYYLLGLNHVVRELRVDLAHAIDIDVVRHCAEHLETNCRFLLMPRHPHAKHRPGLPLEAYFEEIPLLRALAEQGRLVWYNLKNMSPHGDSPVVQARFFSVEAALDILGLMGVRKVRSLGIDGGQGYSRQFQDLQASTMLANGQDTFDHEFQEISRIAQRHGIDYAPLAEPMRVFVGTDESQVVAARVLEYTIRRHASGPVLVNYMLHVATPRPRHRANRPRTGFSFRRFVIPKLCGYRGRALYVDADMQVFGDLAELWAIPFGEHRVLCTYQAVRPAAWKHEREFQPGRQLSVMMLDCSRLAWDVDEIVRGLDEGRYDYKTLMHDLCVVAPQHVADTLPPEWNCLEWYDPARSKLVHYTVVPTQPWKNDDNPLRGVWETAYRQAVAAGAVPPADVARAVAQGHVKPSLLEALSMAPQGAGELLDRGWFGRLKYQVVPPVRTAVRRLRRAAGNTVRRLRTWRAAS
jgi:hypothetical protein